MFFNFSPPRGGTVSIAKLLLTETKAMQLEGFKVVGRMAIPQGMRKEQRATIGKEFILRRKAMSKEIKVCILMKNSKYGIDFDVYSETEAKTINLEKEQQNWHQRLINDCDIEPTEDDYVEWYDAGWGRVPLVVKGVNYE